MFEWNGNDLIKSQFQEIQAMKFYFRSCQLFGADRGQLFGADSQLFGADSQESLCIFVFRSIFEAVSSSGQTVTIVSNDDDSNQSNWWTVNRGIKLNLRVNKQVYCSNNFCIGWNAEVGGIATCLPIKSCSSQISTRCVQSWLMIWTSRILTHDLNFTHPARTLREESK